MMLKDTVIANRSYGVLNIAPGQKLDQIAIEVMKQDCPDFLLAFKTISIDGALELRYEMGDGIRLSYQSQRMYKREFVQQMINMLLPYKDCGDWLLDYHSILLDPKYIFVSNKNGSVRYTYIPVPEYALSDEEIMRFFSQFMVNVELLDDKDYILQLLRIMQNGRSNLLAVLEHLQKEKNMHMDTFKGQPANPERAAEKEEAGQQAARKIYKSGEIGMSWERAVNREGSEQEERKSGDEFGKDNIENKLLDSLYRDTDSEKEKEKKGKGKREKGERKKEKKEKPAKEKAGGKGLLDLFGGKKEKAPGRQDEKEPEQPAKEAGRTEDQARPAYYNDVGEQTDNRFMDIDTTEVEGEFQGENDPSILLLKLENARDYDVPELIELHLEHGHATVGRYDKHGSPCADFNFDYSLTFVSRNHFRVELQGDKYQIIDLNSGNGTILNDQELIPNMPYELHSKDVIVISRKTRLTYHVL